MSVNRLLARRAGIDTYQQPVVYMRSDCHVCRAEGFQSQEQVEVISNGRHLLAILHHVEIIAIAVAVQINLTTVIKFANMKPRRL